MLLGVAIGTGGATTALPATRFDCRFTEQAITIDGRIDEPAWQDAVVIDRGSPPPSGREHPSAARPTKARLLWDREHLYVAAVMDDRARAPDADTRHGSTGPHSGFELVLNPSPGRQGVYRFRVTPSAKRFGQFLVRRGDEPSSRHDRAFSFTAAVAVRGSPVRRADRDDGWTVELRIPWSDLMPTGGRPEPGEQWRVALSCRDDDGVAATALPAFDLEDQALVQFTGPAETPGSKPFGIPRYVPVTTNWVAGAPEPPPPYIVENITPGRVMDAPIVVAAQPGSELLLVATAAAVGRPSQVLRTRAGPHPSEPETLIPTDHPERTFGTVHYSITFHPEFSRNGHVFIGSNGPRRPDDAASSSIQPGEAGRMTRITRYRIDPQPPYTFHADSARLIIEWDSDGHDGGDVAFGPDGMLYVTSGDGSSDSDADLAGQDLGRLRAKVLRIDVDHPDAALRPEGKAYRVPPDNPFVDRPNVRPETWAYGLRNPWRITCDRETGQIWVGNNGQDLWEQVYLLKRGANYGWSVQEGSHPFAADRPRGPEPITPPTFEHSHAEARSLTGGVVYRGDLFPELHGCYLYGDYSTGRIWAAKHDGQQVLRHDLIADTTLQITSFSVSDAGDILISDHRAEHQGGIYRLACRPPTAAVSRPFPRRLSESGLFKSIPEHTMAAGVVPYGVNSPLWSDGSHKVRFLALPSRGDAAGRLVPEPIEVTNENGWDFPDGTVLVKSFAIEREQGNPATRQWIETRFMLREAGEWAGYSYAWNADQTDAVLVEAEGRDAAFTVRTDDVAADPEGVKTLAWRYPSRTECMVCHSRAANFVLGLCTVQLNRDFDYAAVLGAGHATDNQLRTLEHLGILRSNWWEDAVTAFRKALPPRAEGETRTAWKQRVRRAIADWTAPLAVDDPAVQSRHSRLLSRPPAATNRLADPHDPTHDLASRARSYLHSNCSSCHQPAGGGNAMINLLYRSAFDEHELSKQRLLDERPMHHTFGLPDPRIIAAGAPARSVLCARIARRGPGQMPQSATTIIDKAGLAVVEAWVESLAPLE